MAWTSPDSWATRLFSGDPLVILLSFLVALTLPVLLHIYFYTTSARAAITPAFLLLGPSGSGKTSLISLLQKRSGTPDSAEASLTRTSQIPSTVNLLLPTSVPLGSNKYRSKNDVTLQETTKIAVQYQMIDTPGHGKLRSEQALSHLLNPAVRGVIFVVDASALDSSDPATIKDTAAYLHDTLLALQRRKTTTGASKAKTDVPVLIAANKQDLFTAIPTGAVKDRLQMEVQRVRDSKRRGLTTVGEEDEDEEDDVFGGGQEKNFSFQRIAEEHGIVVEVVGGAVKGEEAGKGVRKWEEWIGSNL